MTSLHSRTFPFLSALPRRRSIIACALALLLAACATRVPAPVEDRSMRPPPRGAQPVPTAPVGVKPAPAARTETVVQTYTVKRGDTLYLIALDHGLDYRELAAWNNIENVNVIRVGQVLRLAPPGETPMPTETAGSGVSTAPLRTVPPVVAGGPAAAGAGSPSVEPRAAPTRQSETYKSQPKAAKEPYSEHALREMQRAGTAPQPAPPSPAAEPAPATPPSTVANAAPKLETPRATEPRPPAKPAAGPSDDDEERMEWVWPAQGKLVTGFSDTANLKGIDIAGSAGQPVLASAAGKVVYAGSGLRGYGKLIIIKHNKAYLSAYAHNKDILVKEGQQVTRGQKIAEMGNTDSDQVKLHFEIRRLGKPIDPLKYLPPA